MKKLLTILVLLCTFYVSAQVPQGFSYQATVRNSAGDLIINQNVYFKFNVMQGSGTSTPVYSETHYAPTDDQGHVNLVVGQGTATIGTFSGIDWSTGVYYLGIELNVGSGYVAMGTTQLLSVPYALYAQSSGGGSLPSGGNPGDMLYWNGNSWVTLPAGLPGQILSSNSSNLPEWIFNTHVENSRCIGEDNGYIQIFMPEQVIASNYTWEWTGPNSFVSTNQNIDNLQPGTYNLTATYNGISYQTSYTISDPAQHTVTVLQTIPVSCFGNEDGTVIIGSSLNDGSSLVANITGTDAFGDPFNMSTPVSANSNININLPPGSYSINFVSQAGCTSNSVEFIIDQGFGTPIDFSGNYTSVVQNTISGFVRTFTDEVINSVGSGNYHTTYTGTWLAGQLAPATSQGYTFRQFCGKLKVEEQQLAGYWGNLVYQTEDQLNNSVYNSTTMVFTIHYTISFAAGNQTYMATYTPN